MSLLVLLLSELACFAPLVLLLFELNVLCSFNSASYNLTFSALVLDFSIATIEILAFCKILRHP